MFVSPPFSSSQVELLQWFVAPGDVLSQFDRVCEVQSDKATVEITSRYDGKVLNLNGNVGDMMKVGEALLDLDVEGSGGSVEIASSKPGEMKEELSIPSAAAVPRSPVAPAAGGNRSSSSSSSGHGPRTPPSPSDPASKVKTTPAVRKIARENNIDLNSVQGTGSGGRVLKEDVLNYLSGGGGTMTSGGIAIASPPPSSSSPSSSSTSSSDDDDNNNNKNNSSSSSPLVGDRTEPIRGYARLMVETMTASLKIPHFGYNDEVRIDELKEVRKGLERAAKAKGIKLR